MKILFCPAHFRFTNSEGSEFYSAYNVAHRIASIFKESVIITGKSDIKNAPYQIIESQRNKEQDWMLDLSKWSTLSSILFTLSYTKAGFLSLSSKKFDIIHHVRPFAIGSTFNILPFLPAYRKMPFVIGEFCSPYSNKSLKGEQKYSILELSIRILTSVIQPILYCLSLMTLKRANAILVTDQNTKELLLAKKIMPDRIFVIPHGKDKKEYYFNEQKFKDKEVRILIAGRLTPRKRVDLAIRAFAIALKSDNQLLLEIAGKGTEKIKLEQLVEELEIKANVKFLGAIPYNKMPQLFSKSQIYLHTASEEAFGQVYIEALASGVPIISTSTIGAREILNSQIGILLENDSALSIAQEILTLSQDIQRRKAMSSDARSYFENHYDFENIIIPNILKIYQDIIIK